ncbi:MAG: type II secretion system F family protein [Mycobacteriales bacterium]
MSAAVSTRRARARLRCVAARAESPSPRHSPPKVALARAWHGLCAPVYLCAAAGAWAISGLVLAALVCCYVWLLRRALRTHARRSRTLATQLLCSEACSGIADDLRAGRLGHLALAGAVDTMIAGLSQLRPTCSFAENPCRDCAEYLRAIHSWRLVREAAATDGVGVVAALRAIGEPHRFWCSRLAAAWRLHESGMALAVVLDSLDEELASQRRQGQTQRVNTAAARATSVVLGFLPVLGLGVGYAMGSDPVAVLLHTPLGVGCAAAATLLHCAGCVWADRIADMGTVSQRVGVTEQLKAARTPFRRHLTRTGVVRTRLQTLASESDAAPQADRAKLPLLSRPGVRWAVAGLAGVVAGWMVGAPVLAVVVGCATAAAVIIGARQLGDADARRLDHAWLDQLPYALVLLSGVLSSGAATAQALSVVGRAVGDRLGASLRVVGTAMVQGEPIPVAWQRGMAQTPLTAPLLRALRRSDTSGAALAGTCRRLAGQLREHAHTEATAAASRCSVWMIAPLMCCFLPAFVLLGVVPVIVGILAQTLGVTV